MAVTPDLVVLSHRSDEHALAFLALCSAATKPLLIDVGREGLDFVTTLTSRGCLSLRTRNGETHNLADVAFWWNRRPVFRSHPGVSTPYDSFQETETLRFWTGIFQSQQGGVWCNPYHCHEQAKSKVRQIFIAKACGLSVPDTVWSNDPEEIEAFYEKHGRRVVIKMFEGTERVWQPTRELGSELISNRDMLRFSPSIIQEYVDGVRELRIVMFGDSVFSVETRVGCSRYEFDVRIDKRAERHPATPESAVVEMLRSFMKHEQLLYAAFDLRDNRRGEPVFLEVNPMGQFLYLDKYFDGRIMKAFCAFAETYVRSQSARGNEAVMSRTPQWANASTVPYFDLIGGRVSHLE